MERSKTPFRAYRCRGVKSGRGAEQRERSTEARKTGAAAGTGKRQVREYEFDLLMSSTHRAVESWAKRYVAYAQLRWT